MQALQLTPKQANIYAWGWQPDARFRDAVCGRRFGKTYLGQMEMRRAVKLAARWSISPDDEIWYAAPSFKQAKRVFWRRLKRAIKKKWREKTNESDCSITLKTGHVVRCVGLDAYDNLRGSGLFFLLVDEWADCPFEAWEEVLRPMLSTCKWFDENGVLQEGGHALRIGTPKGFNHCYDTYQMGQPGPSKDPEHMSWLYTTLQGGNVPQKEIDAAMRTMDVRSFRQEYDASFENYTGRVYYAFHRQENVKSCPYNPKLDLHIGMDFNVNPMSATIFQEQPNGEVWQVGEITIMSSNTHEMCDEIATRYGKPTADPLRPDLSHITIYPDPAGVQNKTSAQGKTDISILRSKGFKVIAMESHPLIRDRINLVNGRFQSADTKRHLFVDNSCTKSIKCYEQLCYKEDANNQGTNQPDKKSGLDHLPDATGYYFFTKFIYIPAQRKQVTHMGR